jgi:hypothetical protein
MATNGGGEMSNKKDFRSIIFGMNKYGVQNVTPLPGTAEECGVYIHVEDIEKFKAFVKQFEEPQRCKHGVLAVDRCWECDPNIGQVEVVE